LPAFEHDDEVAELDGHRHVATGDPVNTLGQFV
jgi:hypothetical protein